MTLTSVLLFVSVSIMAIILIMHIISVIKIGGYKIYIENIRVLKNFKSVDYKAKHDMIVYYNINGFAGTSTHNFQKKETYISAFYFINSKHFLQIYYENEFKLLIKIIEQKFNNVKGGWCEMDYKIYPIPDLIYILYYTKVTKLVKKSKCMEVKDSNELWHSANSAKRKKYRSSVIDELLD